MESARRQGKESGSGAKRERPHALVRESATEKFFDGTGKILGTLSSALFLPMMLLGGGAGFLSKRTRGAFSEKMGNVKAISELPNANIADIPEALGQIAPKAGEQVRKVGDYANKMLGNDLSGRLGKVSTVSAVQLGIGGFSVANTVRTFGDKIKVLKHLHRDVTGRNISTFSLLTGHNLPPIVKQARGHSLGVRVGVAALLDTALTAFNFGSMLYPDKQPKFMQSKLATNPFFQVVGMGALYQIPQMLVGAGGNDPLSTYKEAHRLAAQTQMPQEAYITLVRCLAPDNMTDQEVAARAKQCFSECWSPKQVAVGMAETYGLNNSRRPVIGPATARLSAESGRQQQLSAT